MMSQIARKLHVRRVALAAGIMLALSQPALAQRLMVTQQNLLDRIQIEDLITSYYYHLGGGEPGSFAEYYTDDAVFDVNGKVFRGREAITKIYAELGETSPTARGTFHMLLGNPLITVTGDTATARFIWTGIISDTVKSPPRLLEQGREYDLLVKRGGQWLISKRTIISDAALGDEYDKVYKPRRDYDPLKD